MSVQLRPKWDKIRDKPDLLLVKDLLSATFKLRDEATGIFEVQRVEGAFGVLDATKTKEVWTDYATLTLFQFSNGNFLTIGGKLAGSLN